MSARTSATPPAARIAHLVALALALVTGGCEQAAPTLPLRTAAGTAPNVLLITVDALRADHLGAYGFPVATSPTIDRLAADGVRVTEAIATAPDTAPAVASLLTGLYQYRTQVLFDGGSLTPEVPTLAERMRDASFTTAGFVGTPLLAGDHGFGRGFERFETFGDGGDAEGVTRARAWLTEAASGDAPWFLWLHLVAPHGPYTTADASLSDAFEYPPYMFGADAEIIAGPSDFGLGVLPKYQQIPGATRPSAYIRRYDGEIRHVDGEIARLLNAVGSAGVANRTLVVLTASHGESLNEHRELFQHGWFLYDATLHVPLVLSWPGVLPAGRVVERQVSGVDLVPTLAALIGLPEAKERVDGLNFAPELLADADTPTRGAFAIGGRENRPLALRWSGWKMIHTPAGRPPVPLGRMPTKRLDTPERFELYNLRDDPDERTNVAHKHGKVRDGMQRTLRQFRQSLRTRTGAP